MIIMPKSKVSVVLPCFNGERFIEKQIMSILNQTYNNIELIIVDDRSTDNTANIVFNLVSRFPHIRFYQNSSNLGLNKNFEKAISLATSEYIALSDQDDIWLPTKIAELMGAIGDQWLIFSNSRLIDEDDKAIEGTLLEDFSLERQSFKSISLNNFVTGHTTLFNRELLNYALPIPSTGYYDWWMGFIAIYHNKIKFLDRHLTLYRIHSASVIQQQEKRVLNEQTPSTEVYYHATLTNFCNLENYKFLKREDQQFLRRLGKLYRNKAKFLRPLTIFYYIHFNDLFPSLNKRKFISKARWKLARRFSKT